MAKNTAVPKRRDGRPRQTASVTMTASPAYAEWLSDLSDHTSSLTLSACLRDALKHYAQTQGFRPPPPG